MKQFIFTLIVFTVFDAQAQIGVGTTSPTSTLDVNGSISNKVTTITNNVTLDINNAVVLCNNTGTINVTLPSATNIAGRIYNIKSINTGLVNIATSGGQTMDGLSSVSLSVQYDALQFISDGSNWFILNKKINSHFIGETFGGGIIFYLDGTGNHGLIAAPGDQSTGVKWNNTGAAAGSYFYAQLQGIYDGQANTYFVISFNPGTYAASICFNLSLNGYNDWYLPSADELNYLYKNLHEQGLGNFSGSSYYWSSTAFQYLNEGAYGKYFGTGEDAVFDISDLNRVRAVRAF